MSWRGRPWGVDRGLAASVASAAQALTGINRTDLVAEVARQAILHQTPSDWRPAREGAPRLLAVVRALSEAAPDLLEDLMIQLAGSGDLDRMYNHMKASLILELMHELWRGLGDRASPFVTPRIRRAIKSCFSPLAVQRPEGLRTMIRAAGLCSTMGVPHPLTARMRTVDRATLAGDDDALVAIGLAVLASKGAGLLTLRSACFGPRGAIPAVKHWPRTLSNWLWLS